MHVDNLRSSEFKDTINVGITQTKQATEQNVIRGGGAYEKNVYDAIKKEYSTEFRNIYLPNSRYKFLRLYGLVKCILNFSGEKDVWIRDFKATAIMSYDKTEGKTISIFHHYDPSPPMFGWVNRKLYGILLNKFFSNARDIECVVTVSDYWKEYLIQKEISNVIKIPNAFNFNDFIFNEEELASFKVSHGFDEDRPIIYLGNCQEVKGAVHAYRELKDMDAYLVTSGTREVEIPTINLELNYRDYLRLLKCSNVVITMSLFNEGWCRTAHEAMLCGTPVIGSGRGGMKELLEGGSQIICENFSDLASNVEYVLQNRELRGLGYHYAYQEQFSLEYFEREWINLIKSI